MDSTLAQLLEELVATARHRAELLAENAALKQKVAGLEKAQIAPDKATG